MKRTWICLGLLAAFVVAAPARTAAQSESQEKKGAESSAAADRGDASGASDPAVLTNADLRKRFGKTSPKPDAEPGDKPADDAEAPRPARGMTIPDPPTDPRKKPGDPSLIITNEYLDRRYEAPAPAPAPGPDSYTMKGEPGPPPPPPPPPPTRQPASAPAPDAGAAQGAPAKTGTSGTSSAERAQRIAEIDTELSRLKKRILAIRNPLLAGTVPPTQEETKAEKGMQNIQRLEKTEARIAELEAERAKLD